MDDVAASDEWGYAHVAIDDAGNAYAIWSKPFWSGPCRKVIELASSSPLRPSDGSWSADESIADPIGNYAIVPRLAVPAEGNGKTHAIWMDKRNGNQDIFHATRPVTGTWGAVNQVNDDTGAAMQDDPVAVIDAAGDLMAVWVDQRGGNADLYQAFWIEGKGWLTNTLLANAPAPCSLQQVIAADETMAPRSPKGAIASPSLSQNGAYAGYSAATTSDPTGQHNGYILAIDPNSQLASIKVTPEAVTLKVGNQQLFTAKGFDPDGQEVAITPEWSTTGGSITQDGLYTAEQTGDYSVLATVRGSSVTGEASVHVDPASQLASIKVTPEAVTLKVGNQQSFTAKGFDPDGQEVAITPEWSTTGGSITQDGLYTAEQTGDYSVIATVRGSSVTGEASIQVDPNSQFEH